MYIDTSVAIKLYFSEPDSEACERVAEGNTLVSSRLLHCEFQSALQGKISRGNLTAETGRKVWQSFESDIAHEKIQFVSLTDFVVQDAGDLLRDLHPRVMLRALDAIHLATYLDTESGPLFTKDLRMLEAARFLGLVLAG